MALKFGSALLAAASLCLLATGSARALDFTVDDCSSDAELRLAIQQITLDAGGGSLRFDCGSNPVTIVLDATDGALPMVTTSAEVDGGGLVTISGGGQSRIFTVGTEGSLTLKNIRIVDGYPGPQDGGAIANLGTLVVHNTVFEGNHAPETRSGGAIVSYGSLQVTASQFISNEAGGAGAIYIRFPGAVTSIADSHFAGNRATGPLHGEGGAIQVGNGASLTILRNTLERNHAVMGGSIFVESGSMLNIESSLVTDNQASTDGGAIYALGSSTASRSLLARNEASRGGAIFSATSLTVTSSTLDSNAAAFGGAFYIDAAEPEAEVIIRSSTLTGNHGDTSGSALAAAGGAITFRNTILGENDGSANCSILAPPQASITSDGSNLTDDSSCGLNAVSDRISGNLALAPLALGAGATPVRRPLPESPAIDTGTCDLAVGTDQRGITRPQPQGATCDVGAVEVRNFTLGIQVSGTGTVESVAPHFTCATSCVDTFPEGTGLTLIAQPAAGFSFAGWTGACTGVGNCLVVLETDIALQATFKKDPPLATPPPAFMLAVNRVGDGLVVSEPAGITCGSTCRTNFGAGVQVHLSAEPGQGKVFGGWGSACIGTGACTVTMTSHMTVTASFVDATPTATPEWRMYFPGVMK